MHSQSHAEDATTAAFARALKLHQAGRLGEALALYRAVLARRPDHAAAWSNLGIALRARGAAGPAIACYRRAIELETSSVSLGNLGNALKDAGRFDEAVAAHGASVAANPTSSRARHNHAIALKAAGRPHDALAELDAARRLDPAAPGPRWDRALILLALGRYTEGWAEYESRWLLKDHPRPRGETPRWNGQDFAGKALLVYPEQGFGDAILTARFISAVRARGGRVIFECKPELRRLFHGLAGVDRLSAPGERIDVDLAVPAMSLPGLLGVSLDTVPPSPRPRVPSAAVARARSRLAPYDGRFKVGIVWSGSVTFKGNALRATRLDQFLRLAEVEGVQLFSLQKGPPAAELGESGAGGSLVVDLAGEAGDFADTAAMIENLDLIVMTDSAVAHLAGSLGRPVWNLLNLVPYWLYLREREDTPWYPTMRLFRQERLGDWDGVFARVADALKRAVAAKRAGRWPR